MIYIALLRGINVGGGNKVDMKKLKQTFESLRFENVRTYINSGNVIFETKASSEDTLAKTIEAEIAKDFQLSIPALVRSAKNIQAISRATPEDWINNTEIKTDVIFLWPEIDSKKILKEFPINPDIETLIYTNGALVWNIERKHYGKSKVPKVILGKVYKQITIRNINTVRKLNSLLLE
ncbi:MAG TPA: DUF1697 domain-containing protein [Candidatus Paceibacterota bacterium]